MLDNSTAPLYNPMALWTFENHSPSNLIHQSFALTSLLLSNFLVAIVIIRLSMIEVIMINLILLILILLAFFNELFVWILILLVWLEVFKRQVAQLLLPLRHAIVGIYKDS